MLGAATGSGCRKPPLCSWLRTPKELKGIHCLDLLRFVAVRSNTPKKFTTLGCSSPGLQSAPCTRSQHCDLVPNQGNEREGL